MWVKICGITSEQDALLAVAMGADAVGFVFAPSPRQMSPNAVNAIIRRLPPEVLTVGLFRDERAQRVVEIINRAGLKAAQLHGHESREDCGYVAVRVPLVIKAFAAGDSRLARAGEYGAGIILLDAPSPGSGKVFDWSATTSSCWSPRASCWPAGSTRGTSPMRSGPYIRGGWTSRPAWRHRRARRIRARCVRSCRPRGQRSPSRTTPKSSKDPTTGRTNDEPHR